MDAQQTEAAHSYFRKPLNSASLAKCKQILTGNKLSLKENSRE